MVTLDNLTNYRFVSSGSGHAIEADVSHIGNSYTLTNCTYSGYSITDGSTGNEAVYNNSGGEVTINISGGDIPSIRNATNSSTIIVDTGSPCDGIVLIDGLRVSLDNKNKIINIDREGLLLDVNNDYKNLLLDQNYISTNLNNADINLDVINDNIDVILKCGSTLIPKEELVRKIAGSNIGGLRCLVTNANGEVLHADAAYVLAGKEIIGISTQAVAIGTALDVAMDGDELIEPSWNWEMNKTIYATEYGHLTQVIPTTDYVYMVAFPLSPTSIIIRIEPPIFI